VPVRRRLLQIHLQKLVGFLPELNSVGQLQCAHPAYAINQPGKTTRIDRKLQMLDSVDLTT
jgi:hypothetical protein